jgi:hypothetical protein
VHTDALWPERCLNPHKGSSRRWVKQLLFQNPSPSVSIWQAGNGRIRAEARVRILPWSVWLKTLKGDLMEIMELTPNNLKVLCEVDCFWCKMAPEGSLDKTLVNEIYRVIVEKPRHPEKFPYIDCWQDAVLSQPSWLRSYL